MADVRYMYRGYEIDPGESWFGSYLDSWMATRLPLVQARRERDLASMPAEKLWDAYIKSMDIQGQLADKSIWLAGTLGQAGAGLERANIQAQSAANTAATQASIARFQGQTELAKQSRTFRDARENSRLLTGDDTAFVDQVTTAGLGLLASTPNPSPVDIQTMVQQVAMKAQAELAGIDNDLHRGAVTQAIVDKLHTALRLDASTDAAARQAFTDATATYLTGPNGLVLGATDDGAAPRVGTEAAWDQDIREWSSAPQSPGSPGFRPVSLPGEASDRSPTAPASVPGPAAPTPAAGTAPARSSSAGTPGPTALPSGAKATAGTPGVVRPGMPAPAGGQMTVYRSTAGLPILDAAEAARGDIPIAREQLNVERTREGMLLDLMGQGEARTEEERALREKRGQVEVDLFTRAPDAGRQAALEKLARAASADPERLRSFTMRVTEAAKDAAGRPGPVPRYVERSRDVLRKPEGSTEDAATGVIADTASAIGNEWASFAADAVANKYATRNPDGSLTWTPEGAEARAEALARLADVAESRGLSPAAAWSTVESAPMADADKAAMLALVSQRAQQKAATRAASDAADNAKLEAEFDAAAKQYAEAGAKDEAAAKVASAEADAMKEAGMTGDDRAVALAKKASASGPAEAKAYTTEAGEASARAWTPEERAMQRAGIPPAGTRGEPGMGTPRPAGDAPSLATQRRATVSPGLGRPVDDTAATSGVTGGTATVTAKRPSYTVSPGEGIGDERELADAYRAAERAALIQAGMTGDELEAEVESATALYLRNRRKKQTPKEPADAQP